MKIKYIIRKQSDSSFSYLKDDETNSWGVCNIKDAKKFASKVDAENACSSLIKCNGDILEIVEVVVL